MTLKKTSCNHNILKHITDSSNFKENRKTSRLDIPLKAHFKILHSSEDISIFNGAAKDISITGCLLLTEEKIPLNKEIGLTIFLDENPSTHIYVKGTILRLNREENSLYEYGIQFENLSFEKRQIFANYFFNKMYELVGLKNWPTSKK